MVFFVWTHRVLNGQKRRFPARAGVKVVDDQHQLNGNSGWDGDSVQVVFANDARDQITYLVRHRCSVSLFTL
jgi:hypothetical protein